MSIVVWNLLIIYFLNYRNCAKLPLATDSGWDDKIWLHFEVPCGTHPRTNTDPVRVTAHPLLAGAHDQQQHKVLPTVPQPPLLRNPPAPRPYQPVAVADAGGRSHTHLDRSSHRRPGSRRDRGRRARRLGALRDAPAGNKLCRTGNRPHAKNVLPRNTFGKVLFTTARQNKALFWYCSTGKIFLIWYIFLIRSDPMAMTTLSLNFIRGRRLWAQWTPPHWDTTWPTWPPKTTETPDTRRTRRSSKTWRTSCARVSTSWESRNSPLQP